MKEIIKINKKGLLDTYFSEIMDLPQVKKIDWNKYMFKILLGGKGRGKSYLAFERMKEYIKKGEPVIYMRNSLDEIKNMKPSLLEMVKQFYPEQKIRCTDEGISLLEDGKVLITFVSTKNYNKISGNLKPYSMVFYDEFNQVMRTETAKMVDDFFNICQTIFRHKQWDIWACGNTKTANNILFNLLKIEPYLPDNYLTVAVEQNYYAIITYKNELFKNGVADNKILHMMKDLNPRQYKVMMEGEEFDNSTDLVLNKEPDLSKWNKLNYIWCTDIKLYQTYETPGGIWYLEPLDCVLNETTIKDLSKDNMIITLNNKWWFNTANTKLSTDIAITKQLETKLRANMCFFGDYYLYTYLSQNIGWKYADVDFLPISKQ